VSWDFRGFSHLRRTDVITPTNKRQVSFHTLIYSPPTIVFPCICIRYLKRRHYSGTPRCCAFLWIKCFCRRKSCWNNDLCWSWHQCMALTLWTGEVTQTATGPRIQFSEYTYAEIRTKNMASSINTCRLVCEFRVGHESMFEEKLPILHALI
jgi:hypothetical protein